MVDPDSEFQAAPDRGGPPSHAGWLGRLLRLCRKELREVLRDRRTIITLIGMPLLVYPLLSLTFQKFLVSSSAADPAGAPIECLVGFGSEREAEFVQEYLRMAEALLVQSDEAPGLPENLTVRGVVAEDLEEALEQGRIDAALRLLPVTEDAALPDFGPRLQAEILYRPDSPLSRQAQQFLLARLEVVNQRYVRNALVAADKPRWLPAEVESRAIGSAASPISLTTVVPLILILMTITGAVYPAIDVTAGERERGTLEALMAAPVPRLALLAAKYVAVVTVAMLTATANLVAMTVTLLVTPWGRLLFDTGGVSPLAVAQVFLLLVLFAAFFSAILLAITSFARSFKEAQAYLIPLMLLALAPGIMSLMPGIEFNGLLAVTPLVNMVLLARDLLEGEVRAAPAAIAVLSTMLYAVAGIGLAARIFGTDALLSGSRFGWRDLFRRPDEVRESAGIPGALACLAVLFPCYFLLSNALALLPLGQREKLLLAALVTMLLFGGIPLLAARMQHLRLAAAFRLHRAPWPAFLGATVLGLTLWPLAQQLFLFNQWLGLNTIDADKLRVVESLLEEWRSLPPWLIVLCLAVTPAVFEELFFRGYLFSAFRGRLRARDTIWISAILFGLFHVVTASVLAVERFLPSTLLGLMLGWVCWRCASIWPGVLLHACHNGLLLLIAYYREVLETWGLGAANLWHVPWHWLALGFVGLAAGSGLVALGTRGATRARLRAAGTAGEQPA